MADDKGSGVQIETKLVKKLAAILDETGLSEIEVEIGGMRVRVARNLSAPASSTHVHAVQALPAPAAPAAAPAAVAAAPAAAAETRGEVVKSPMVGTVFLQPQPGAERFVKPGSKVVAGQTLLIIEAMKTMNPIPAPRDGVVLELLIDDAQPVEFGEPLIVLE